MDFDEYSNYVNKIQKDMSEKRGKINDKPMQY